MPKITYLSKKFRAAALLMIQRANEIITEYAAQGFDLTLRQLYYQFVSRGFLTNNQKSYKQLGNTINDGRLAGLIDWNRIEDRTRGIETISTWDNPADVVEVCSRQFKIDKWSTQPYRVEVWIEKEALAGVFQPICTELRIPYLSCRGYTSQSEMWRAGQRMRTYISNEQTPFILHFGDHDPSGIDMGRDIVDRLAMFAGEGIDFKRLALNMEQVEEFSPPPNPAKMTDARAEAYVAQYGDQSWELDALEPTVLASLVRDSVESVLDAAAWADKTTEEDEGKRLLQQVSENWEEIVQRL